MEIQRAEAVAAGDWLGFDWSDWMLLEPGTDRMTELPRTPGFFRVKRVESETLDYVGQTGEGLRSRIGHLANRVQADERPRHSQASAEHLWELESGRFEVSHATPTIARSEADRIGIEHVMFAMHVRAVGRSPTVNLDRNAAAEERDALLHGLEWDADEVTARDWLGLDWSEPRDLADRTEIDRSRVVYRIWFPGFAPPLAYIGKSTNVANRLIKHETKFGSDALFAVAPVEQDLKDVEACCIASHYLATNELPKGQNGRRNRFSWGD